jgi:hypothetical protein
MGKGLKGGDSIRMGLGGGEQGEGKIGVGRSRGPVKAGKSKMYLVRPELGLGTAGKQNLSCRGYPAPVSLLPVLAPEPCTLVYTSSTNSDSLTF